MAAKTDFDVAVLGGGLVGAAIAFGLAGARQRVAVLDEGDVAFRASRGNFALVWVQSKGLGMSAYAGWTLRSSEAWAGLAATLQDETGIDVRHQRPGGFHLTLSDAEFEKRATTLKRLHNQPEMVPYEYRMIERAELERMLPHIGPEVVGASYCPADGHVNSLKLFRAFHVGLQQRGGTYLAEHPVERIEPRTGGFRMVTPHGTIEAQKVVLTAGIGNARLAPMVGLSAPVRPQRGQVIVTEKAAPFLHHPIVTIRQTDEGGVMIGDSQEEAGADPTVGLSVIAVEAERAVRMFPLLGRLNVVRSWAALRVMTQDGFPIYDQSAEHPGAFLATCHSGVTLAANHALTVAPHIAAGHLPPDIFASFSAKRFDVPTPA